MTILVQQYTLIAAGRRTYTFTPLPGGVEVVVRFTAVGTTVELPPLPVQEARDLWKRLRRKGYERW